MAEASSEWNIYEPRIHNSSDSAMEREIKKIILPMLRFDPAHRITAAEVVDRLTELQGDKTEAEQSRSWMPEWWSDSNN